MESLWCLVTRVHYSRDALKEEEDFFCIVKY
jgi:hypothetical protein